MKAESRALQASAGLMMVAVILMLVCVLDFSSTTMALFLSVGLMSAFAGFVVFGVVVWSDLRRRGVL